jgi:hypothetical protein
MIVVTTPKIITMVKIDGLHFQPWVGSRYYDNGNLFLFGESHYLDDVPNEEDDFSAGYDNMTIETIRDNHLAEKDMRTPYFRNIGRLFYPNDYYTIWNEISFANAIQIGMPNAKSQPGSREIATIAPAFKLYLDVLKPSKVLVLSKRLWNYWLPEDNGQYVRQISANGKYSTVWEYQYEGGRCLAMGIKHPSWMFGYSCHDWRPLVDKFLSL